MLLTLGINIIGIMSFFFYERQQRAAFLETRQSLETKLILEQESQEQVSCLPLFFPLSSSKLAQVVHLSRKHWLSLSLSLSLKLALLQPPQRFRMIDDIFIKNCECECECECERQCCVWRKQSKLLVGCIFKWADQKGQLELMLAKLYLNWARSRLS